MVLPLVHKNPEKKSDEELVTEANAHFKGSRVKQVVATFISLMREHQFPGLTHEDFHKEFPADVRMGWLKNRPDRRQQIVTELVGTKPNMARKRELPKQAQDIEDTLESQDITCKDFDVAYTPEDWASYGNGEGVVDRFFDKFDWTDSKDVKKQAVVANFINEFLAVEPGLKPILTHLQVRRAISSVTWNKHLPVELRAKIDDARLEKQEKSSREPFTAAEELALVPAEEFVKYIPLDELVDVFRAAMKAMGFKVPGTATDEEKADDAEGDKPTTPPPSTSNDGPNAPLEIEVVEETVAKQKAHPPPIKKSDKKIDDGSKISDREAEGALTLLDDLRPKG